MFLGKSKHMQKINAVLLPDMEKALKRLNRIRQKFPQLKRNPYMFAIKGVKAGYIRGSKAMEHVCRDLGMTMVVTAGMIRRMFATKAVFEANSKNQRL